MLAAMMQEVHLVEVEPNAGLLVAQECIGLPTVPQADDNVVEFDRAVVTFRVIDMPGQAKIAGLILDLRGDEIPTRPAATDVIDRGETASDIVRLVISGSRGRDIGRASCRERE